MERSFKNVLKLFDIPYMAGIFFERISDYKYSRGNIVLVPEG